MSDNLQQQELDQIADDVRSNLTKSVEHIIRAGQALQCGRDMHPSDNAFHDWCAKEFPDLNRKMRSRIMQVGTRFGGTFMSHQLPITVLYELSAPSLPEEKAHEFLEQNPNPSVKDVKEFKEKVLEKKPIIYKTDQSLTAIMMLAERFKNECTLEIEEASRILLDVATKDPYNASSYIRGLLTLKQLLDYSTPDLNRFSKERLKIVN
jgi:hypothetical protein